VEEALFKQTGWIDLDGRAVGEVILLTIAHFKIDVVDYSFDETPFQHDDVQICNHCLDSAEHHAMMFVNTREESDLRPDFIFTDALINKGQILVKINITGSPRDADYIKNWLAKEVYHLH